MATKKLARSRDHRMISGVAGGIGDYLGIDSNLVRLVFGVLAVVTVGGAILVYLVGWLLLPDEYDDVRGFDQVKKKLDEFGGKKSDGYTGR
ncbi:PspC domain-containing protein [uncultured Propionibacterium sp.]|uniref:PspC domain-containing protein n=1 Tax=uncultured Propionibacterium sp. TaxID=218066 RepID=UPI00292DFFCA|nr:PspC domain-containing protein [uncultured Propionibacterium sp.]